MQNQHKIVIARNIGPLSAILAWLILFVMPSFLVSESLSQLLFVTKSINTVNSKDVLINEINQFKKDFTYKAFLSHSCKKILNLEKQIVKDFKVGTLVRKLRHVGIVPSIIILHNEDTQGLQFYYSNEVKEKRIKFPIYFTKNLLVTSNQQYLHSIYNKALRTKFNRQYNEQSIEKKKKDAGRFLQKKLKLARITKINDGVVKRAISGALDSQVYMLHLSTKNKVGKKDYIDRGMFLIVKDSDISMKKVKAQSLIPVNKDVTRSFSILSKSMKGFGKSNVFKVSSFTIDGGDLSFQTPYPHDTLIHHVQEGGLIPKHLDRTYANMPLIKVTIPSNKLSSSIEKYVWLIFNFFKLLVVSSAVILLWSCLFGLEFNFSLRNKLIIGLVIILSVPVLLSLFSISIYSQMDAKRLDRNRMQKIRFYQEQLQSEFQDYISNKQMAIVNFSKQLQKIVVGKSEKVGVIIKKWLEENRAVDVVFRTLDESKETIINDNFAINYSVDTTNYIARNIFIDTLYDASVKGILINGGLSIRPSVINSFLLQNGKLLIYDRLGTNHVISTIQLLGDDNVSYGVAQFRYSRNELVSEFIETIAKKRANQFLLSDNIETAFYEIGPEDALSELFSNLSLQDISIENNTNISVEQKKSMKWNYIKGNWQHLCRTKYNLPFPFLTFSVLKIPVSQIGFKLPLFSLIYIIVLFTFIYMLFGKTYLEPIHNFESIAMAIENGNYTETANISGIIEFEKLKQAFENMTYGLAQKEALARFVSKEVLYDVESSVAIKAGGEKIEATVLFICINNFDVFVTTNSAQATMNLMNQFMTLVEIEVTKYNGEIDKIIDGSLMIVFKGKNHVIESAKAALSISAVSLKNNIITKSGFATGNIVSGKIGSTNGRLDQTVIGDTVNMAARLKAEALKSSETTGIIIAPSSLCKIKGVAIVKFLKRTTIKGKSREYSLFELIGLRQED